MEGVTKREKTALDIVGKYGENSYDLACIDEIHDTFLIPYADMVQLRVFVFIAEVLKARTNQVFKY